MMATGSLSRVAVPGATRSSGTGPGSAFSLMSGTSAGVGAPDLARFSPSNAGVDEKAPEQLALEQSENGPDSALLKAIVDQDEDGVAAPVVSDYPRLPLAIRQFHLPVSSADALAKHLSSVRNDRREPLGR